MTWVTRASRAGPTTLFRCTGRAAGGASGAGRNCNSALLRGMASSRSATCPPHKCEVPKFFHLQPSAITKGCAKSHPRRRRAVRSGRCPVRAQGSKVRVADHSGSIASWLESGVGASYGIMRTNCPDLPGKLQFRGGLPPETHGNPWPVAQR